MAQNDQMLKNEQWDQSSDSLPPTRWATPPRPDVLLPGSSEQFGRFAEHWNRRDIMKHIRAKPSELYPDAESLMMGCIEYFEWNNNNHIKAEHLSSFQGVTNKTKVDRMRAPSLRGLLNRLGISMFAWEQWRELDPVRRPVCHWAENLLFTIKFEAASADMINPTIAMRDLGLTERQEIKQDIKQTVTEYELPSNNRTGPVIEGDFREVDE